MRAACLAAALLASLPLQVRPAHAGMVRATLALEHDDNPFEQLDQRRAGWVTRLYLYSDSPLIDHPRATVGVRHHWGIKRFWRTDRDATEAGDVVANQVDLGGTVRAHPRIELRWGLDVKLKSVQRVSSEESYLRGGGRLGVRVLSLEHLVASLDYARHGDDARDERLVDMGMHELAAGLDWQPSRRLALSTGLCWRWLDYDRPVLRWEAGAWTEDAKRLQEDRAWVWRTGLSVYRGVLVQANYAYAANASNSAGYDYRSHRVQVALARPLAYGVDGQVFATAQVRSYDDELPSAAGPGGEQDEYEQSLWSVKLDRQCGSRYGVSCQYKHARNGSQVRDDSFRKNTISLSLDMVL